MSVRHVVTAALVAICSLPAARAQEMSAQEPVSNWTAPPYWTPPGAKELPGKEQGLIPEGAEAVEGLPTSPLPFFGIAPCRIVDTRGGGVFTGAYGPPAMAANASRDFDLNSAAHCPGIPANAEAYSINVTVTETTGLGDVRIWPAGSPPAIPVSTQNWPTANLSIANAAIVPSGTDGAITVYVAGSTTHLIIDINGYYAPISIVNTLNTLSGDLTLAAGSNISITPSGQTLTIANTAPAAWRLTGNSGTTAGTNFLGTTDNQALELKVNNARVLRLEGNATIGGHSSNAVTAGVIAGTIAGGGQSGESNLVTDWYGTVGGGVGNRAGDNAGTTNDRLSTTVSGGRFNIASGQSSVVGGGFANTASGSRATVGGGTLNVASAQNSTIGGGSGNSVTDDQGTVSGGLTNRAGDNAGTTSDRLYATVGGGTLNVASGASSTIPGGENNAASGTYSFAAGRRAKATHNGSFVWGDSTDADITSSAVDTFTVRATGGFRIFLSGGVLCEVVGAGGWQCGVPSDRDLKRDVTAVDGRRTLELLVAMPIQTWSYIDHQPAVRHMGPMAQDFAAAYGLGGDDKMINPLDANGVALAAIQGLYEMVAEKNRRIEALEARLSKLESK